MKKQQFDFLRKVRYNETRIIYSEGDPADAIYFIEKGIVIEGTRTREGNRSGLLLGKMDFFGEDCFALPERTRYAMAIGGVELLWAPIGGFLHFLGSNKEATEKFIKALAAKNTEIYYHASELAYSNAVDRAKVVLAEYGLRLLQAGTEGITVPIPKQEISNLIGATTKTTYRALKEIVKYDGEGGKNRPLQISKKELEDFVREITSAEWKKQTFAAARRANSDFVSFLTNGRVSWDIKPLETILGLSQLTTS